jgi:hypothetical protein
MEQRSETGDDMSETIEVKAVVRLRAWPVPDCATVEMPPQPRQNGLGPLPTIPVEELDDEAVDALARRWLNSLYAARKEEPPFRYNGRARAA